MTPSKPWFLVHANMSAATCIDASFSGRVEQIRIESGKSAPTDPAELQEALCSFEPLWDQLNTAEQERFIRLLVREVGYDGRTETVTVGFHSERIKELCEQ